MTSTNCWLREQISIHECFEAIRKQDNVILQENQYNPNKIRRTNGNTENNNRHRKREFDNPKRDKKKGEKDTEKGLNIGYHTYAEWQKLSSQERKEILEARECGTLMKGTDSQTDKRNPQGAGRNYKRTQRTPVKNNADEKLDDKQVSENEE
jgi:hypothetical protein